MTRPAFDLAVRSTERARGRLMDVRRGLIALALPVASTLAAVWAGTPDTAVEALEASAPFDESPDPDAPACGALAVPPRPIRMDAAPDAVPPAPSEARRRGDRLRSALAGLAPKLRERIARAHACLRDALRAQRRGEMGAALALTDAARREGLANRDCATLRLVEAEREASASGSAERIRRDEEWTSVCEDLLEATRPPPSTVEFPENWIGMVVARSPRSVDDADEPADPRSPAAVVAVLEAKRVQGFELTDTNLDQAITRLRDLTGLAFHLTPEARRTKFDEVRINVPGLDDVSVRWVLTNVVTQPFGLGWEVRDGSVTIGTSLEVRGELRLKYFDVKDLAPKIRNFRGTGPYLAPGTYIPAEDPDADLAEAKFPGDALLTTIQAVVDPDSWDGEFATIDLKNSTLIVKNRAAVIEHVGQLLAELRALPLRPGDIPSARAVSRTVYTIDWGVVDLVGNASLDGSVVSVVDGAPPAPFTPGAFVSALRAQVDEAAWLASNATIELTAGTLTVRGDYGTVRRIDRAIAEMRARARISDGERTEIVVESR